MVEHLEGCAAYSGHDWVPEVFLSPLLRSMLMLVWTRREYQVEYWLYQLTNHRFHLPTTLEQSEFFTNLE